MKQKLKTDLDPAHKSILVLRLHEEVVTKSNIIISETTKEPRPVGIIVAVSDECSTKVKQAVGKKILFNRFANLEVTDGLGQTLLLMPEIDIYCYINDKTLVLDDSGKKEKRIDIKNPNE